MNLNHIKVKSKIESEFNLSSYKVGKFTYFKNSHTEVGYIEQIGGAKYLPTILVNFFDYDNKELNDIIIKRIEELYKIQREGQGIKLCLELRGFNINKSVLI